LEAGSEGSDSAYWHFRLSS